MKRVIQVSLVVLFVPIVELVLFRLWLRFGLQLRLGLPGFVDYDLLLPSLFTFLVFGTLLNFRRPLQPEFQRNTAAVHLVLATSFAVLSGAFRPLEGSIGFLPMITLWTSVLCATVVTGFFLFVPFEYFKMHPDRWLVVPCLLAATSVVMVKHLYPAVWPWYGVATAQGICSALQLLDPLGSCHWASPYYLGMNFMKIEVLFGPPCSGADGLILFLVGFSAFALRDGTTLRKMLTIFVLGFCFTYFLNVLRVVLIFCLSRGVGILLGNNGAEINTLVFFFHTHAGWFLYALGWGLFFWVLRGWKASEFAWGM